MPVEEEVTRFSEPDRVGFYIFEIPSSEMDVREIYIRVLSSIIL
jgi:hypothetical protein